MEHTDDAGTNGRIIAQGRALARAIQALNEIDSKQPFEREMAQIFQNAYRRCLQDIIASAPPRVGEEILGSEEFTPDPVPPGPPGEGSAPTSQARPALAGDPGRHASDSERDEATDGDGEVLENSGLWIHANGHERGQGKQYQTPTLTKRDRKREIRTLPI